MKEEETYEDNINDQIIKDLFNEFEPDKAPEALKQDTMNRVLKDWTENAVSYKPLINKQNRLWLLGGFAALLAVTFLIDSSVITEYWNQLNLDTTAFDFSGFGNGLNYAGSIIKSLPSILYFIGIGILGLLGIDHLFSKLSNI